MAKGVNFINCSVESRVPSNTFIVIDTHSDNQNGLLVVGGGEGSPQYSLTSDVIDEFGGRALAAVMKKASEAALQAEPPQENDWYSDSAFSRGGWRGLLLATCSPVMRTDASFKDVQGLVESDRFDFVLGFAGASTLPTQIRGALSQVIERIGVDKTAGIWDTIIRVIGHDLLLLDVNSVVVVFKERGSKEVHARKIGKHSPPLRPWGVKFHACGKLGCRSEGFFVQSKEYDVRMTCRFCGWVSAWVKEKDWKDILFRVDRTLPNVFWHTYPTSHSLQQLFVEVTQRKEAEGSSTKRL